MTTVVSVAQGGTGSNSAALARTALGVPPSAAYDQANTARTQANTAYSQANSAYSDANTRLSASGGTLAGDLIITGNLTVSGNSTTLNSEILTVEDADIVLLSNVASTPALNAGIIINRGTSTNTFLRWDEVTDKWGWSDDGSTTYKFTSALDAYAQANSAYGAANNTVLKAGDTMTGQLNISSGGLLVTGNVGFGTASPAAKLDVVGTVAISSNLTLNGGTANGVAFLNGSKVLTTGSALTFDGNLLSNLGSGDRARFGTATRSIFIAGDTNGVSLFDGAAQTGNGWYINGANNSIAGYIGGTETMRLTSTGLGIGTASPVSKLTVAGDVHILSTDYLNFTNSVQQTYIHAPASNTMAFGTSSTERMRLDSSGNLGLGVTPSASSVKTFEISAVGDTLSGFGGGDIALMSNAYYNSGFKYAGSNLASSYRQQDGIHKWNIAATGTAGNAITFTQAMTLDSAGNLGVGTSSPTAKLHVINSTPNSGRPTLFLDTNYGNTGDSSTGLRVTLNNNGGGGYIAAYTSEFQLTHNAEYIAGAGFTARSTTASQIYQAAGEFVFYSNQGLTANNTFTFTERMRINSSGNLGIGTTSPAAKLDVVTTTAPAAVFRNTTAASYTSLRLYNDQNSAVRALSIDYGGSTYSGGERAEIFVAGAYPLLFGTNNTERMRISSAGVITMPTQTMISARHNTTETPSAGTPLLQWTIDVDQGGGSWNASTGVYTVPVAGRYFVTCSLLRNSGGAAGGIVLHKNSVSVTRLFYVDNTGTTAYAPGSGQLIVNCGAGDTLKFMNENTVAWYGDGAGLGSFTINLLG